MTWVASDADCIAAQTGAAGVPGAIPPGLVSRHAETFRYCLACATVAGRGHRAHARTPATASIVAAPAAGSHPGMRTTWVDGMWWLPVVTVPTRCEGNVIRQRQRRTGRLTGRLRPLPYRALPANLELSPRIHRKPLKEPPSQQ